MSNLIQFEKENSPFLQKLKDIDYRSILLQIINNDLTILIPTSKSLESIKEINNIFLETHTLYINPGKINPSQKLKTTKKKENPNEFVSLNGIRGTFAKRFDTVNVHSSPLTDESLKTFSKNPLSIFSKK